MRSRFILFSVAIYVCAYTQDHHTSDVSLPNGEVLSKVEIPVEPKNNSEENRNEVLSKNVDNSVTIKSDLSSKQHLTTVSLFENDKDDTIKLDTQNNITFVQEPNKLNDSLSENSKCNSTHGVSDKTCLCGNAKSDINLLKNKTNEFPTVNNILNTTHISPDPLKKKNDENFTNENSIEDSHVNNSSGNEINKSDKNITLNTAGNITLNNTENITLNETENNTLNNTENITLNITKNITLNNTTINNYLIKNISYSTVKSNYTQIQRLTEQSKESDAYNNITHNDSVTTAEYTDESSLFIDSNNSGANVESTSVEDTFSFDIAEILGTHEVSDIDGEYEEEEEEDNNDDDDDDNVDNSVFDSSEDLLESQKPTTKRNVVKENKKELNQKSEGLGILPKIVIFSINVGFVFLAFWLTKTFIDNKMFQEVSILNIPPNGYVFCNSEIFLHKSVQVVILKQPFTENHKTTEYLGVWLF